MAPWHSLDLADTYATLASGPEDLTSELARERLAEHGPNAQRVRGEGPLRILWRQIDNPLIWVLLGSAVVAVGLGKVTDGLVVLAVVVLNSLIGFIQEHRASRAIEVLRDGAKHRVPVADLVPGDSVLLASGNKVPADLRLTAVKNLRCE